MNNKNRVLKNIEELEELYSQVKDRSIAPYLDLLDLMRINYEQANQEENAIKICKEIESFVLNSKLGYNKEQEYLLASYDTRARCGDFRAYCIALEWNRPIEKQYFLPRKKILEKHGLIQAMQDVADGKLDFLFVSMPPRTAKSTTGIFFLSFMAALYPDRSILGSGHSTGLTQSMYLEVLRIFTQEEYRFSEIFPNINQQNILG